MVSDLINKFWLQVLQDIDRVLQELLDWFSQNDIGLIDLVVFKGIRLFYRRIKFNWLRYWI